MTTQISTATLGQPLEATLKALRAAFRQFVQLGGPHGDNFQHRRWVHEADPFSLALGDLRARIGEQLAHISWRYDLEINDEMARILPPKDDGSVPAWLIGFDHE